LEVKPLVETIDLHKHFPVRESAARRLLSREQRWLRAVDGVDLRIGPGEVVGLVGESGCGKSTLGRLLSRLETPTSGTVAFEGRNLEQLSGRELKAVRRRLQIVFQDPYRSLDPRSTVQATVEEPLVRHKLGSAAERAETVGRMLDRVELRPGTSYLQRYPHELSGGQRQRVAIARAMVLEPAFVVADEPVSMLDVSVRAGILNLMLRLKEEFGTSYLFVTHDLSVARYVSDRIAVMYLGRIVEQGPAEEVIQHPQHPYARLLVSAVPGLGRSHRVRATGEMPNAAAIPSGCRFHTRCPIAVERCRVQDPVLRPIGKNRLVACHLAGETIPDDAARPLLRVGS
jgi:oligopeptide/dipeptide ABC transporter ATP-binding protein